MSALLSKASRSCETLARDFSGPVVCAFSGGADSRFLLEALRLSELSERLFVAHVDHGLDELSGARAESAEQVSRTLGLSHVSLDVSLRCDELMRDGSPMEAAARIARYEALKSSFPGGLLFVAHHADDQAETLFFRLGRGAGARGAACMRPRSTVLGCSVARPLLGFRSADIRSELSSLGISWVEDPSNADPDAASRNFIRNELFPLAETRLPGFAKGLAVSAELFSEAADLAADVASSDFASARVEDALFDLSKIRDLSEPRRRNLFLHLPALLDAGPPPSGAQIRQAERQLSSKSPAGAKIRLGRLDLAALPGWRLSVSVSSVGPAPAAFKQPKP